MRQTLSSNRGSINFKEQELISRATEILEEEPKTSDYVNMPNVYYYTISISIYVLVVIAAITLPNIGIVFGIIGSTAVSFIVFLGPAGYFLKSASI